MRRQELLMAIHHSMAELQDGIERCRRLIDSVLDESIDEAGLVRVKEHLEGAHQDSRLRNVLREAIFVLHVQPRGRLDSENVRELLDLLRERHEGAGLIFLDTGALRDVLPQAADTFKASLESDAVIPVARLVFKGVKGLDMAPEGCRVLITPEKRCCSGKGNCSGCDCQSRRDSEPSAEMKGTQEE